MKRIAQFRYKGEAHAETYPTNLMEDNLVIGNIFRDYGPVSQLGIQAPPGLKFYLNNSKYSIMVGDTGIYELDLEGIGRILSISFDRNDLRNFYGGTNKADKLLIDIVYEGG